MRTKADGHRVWEGSKRIEAPSSAGGLLWLIRSGQARTRADLHNLTGLSRKTIGLRLDRLVRAGYVRERVGDESTGGRRPARLEFNDQHGVVLAGHLGATQARLGVLDLTGRPLVEEAAELRIGDGPKPVLDWVGSRFTAMLAECGHTAADVSGVGLGVPGPVEFALGRVRQPPMMPGWDGYDITRHLGGFVNAPVLVDNDANLMALGEQSVHHSGCPALVLVKVATGIGAGVVMDGGVYRGIDGDAGDIGHVRLHAHEDVPCLCGSYGCLTAVASGSAVAQQLTAAGVPTNSSRELLGRLTDGHSEAIRLTREAGQLLGDVLATVVCLLNPGVLVIAGDLAEQHFLTGVRERLYRLALPRATRHLTVTTSRLGDRAGIVGAYAMVLAAEYGPAAVNRRLDEATH